jgi:hypothetical protein
LHRRKILEDFHVEALALGLCEDFLLALIQRRDLFVDVFDALDERANAIARDSCGVRNACSLFQEVIRYSDESHREVNRAAEIPADARPHVAAGALVPTLAHNRVAITGMNVQLD